KSSAAEDGWIVGGNLNGPAGEIDRGSSVRFAVFSPTGNLQLLVAVSRQGEGRTITWITRGRSFEEVEGLIDPAFFVGEDMMRGAQVEVVRGEIVGGSARRSRGFDSLQRRLYGARDARRHLVLKFENGFERAVEAVGPNMRTADCVDQLCADAQPTARPAHRALHDTPHPQFAADLLHIDGLALVRKTGIAGDDEEPADAAERGDDLLDHPVG